MITWLDTYWVDDVRRGHLGDHGHDVDQSDPLASQAGRHHFNSVLEPHIHRVRSKEASQQKHKDL